MFKVLSCLLVAAFGANLYASEKNILLLQPRYQGGSVEVPAGFWPLVGLSAGFMSPTDARTGGIPTQLKVLGSYYFDGQPWVADLGAGLHNEVITQSGTGSGSVQSFYSELAGRYIFSNRWQLGAIWNTLIDNSHRYESNTDNLASFVGTQVLKEFAWNRNCIVRVGGKAMTSLGLNGGSVSTVMAELEVSFGAGSQPHLEPVAESRDNQAMQSYKPESMDSSKLVHALADNRSLYGKIVVIGYFADDGHKAQARTRAHNVAVKLIQAGVQPSQIIEEQRGRKGWLSQRVSPSALLLDERVRVEFEDVKNPTALGGVIDSAAM